MEETDFWKEDWIGLKTLHEKGKLVKFKTNCSHIDNFSPCFDLSFEKYGIPFFNNTF